MTGKGYKGYTPMQNYVLLSVEQKKRDIILLDNTIVDDKQFLKVVAVGSKVESVTVGDYVIVHERCFPKKMGEKPNGDPIVAPGQGIGIPSTDEDEKLIQVMEYDIIGIVSEEFINEFAKLST